MKQRPRRNRRSEALRSLVRETQLSAHDLILPIFLVEGKKKKESISSMPGVYRWSIDLAVELAQEAWSLGIPGVALFPKIDDKLKSPLAEESANPDGLIPRATRALKKSCPELLIICDVAMDPYSSEGHDGLVHDGKVINDQTLPILCRQALVQAKAGADLIAPSDMMDGRVGAIRQALDQAGFQEVGILSYCAKYASSFYGPFRDALDSAPRFGDKKTYQMDPGNRREALREANLDQAEGADILMVKPALAYLDVILSLKTHSRLPIAAYQVSGEYSMIHAAAERGWIDGPKAIHESLVAIKRAGADMIFSYAALDVARSLSLKPKA